MLTPLDIEVAFLDAAAKQRGLRIPRLVADGKCHRCDAKGKGEHGKGDGVYFLHLDGRPNGGFQDCRDGIGWTTWKPDAAVVITPGERIELQARAKERAAERAHLAAEAARRAADFWSRAREADPRHPYLTRKGISPHGVRQLGERLIVPMKDATRRLRGLQFISPDGAKKYLTGTPKTGCAFRIGGPTGVVLIGEGLATASSVHEATRFCSFTAFDADNLLLVARSVRARMPTARIVLCGDDDWRTRNNPGRSKAIEAAAAVGGVAAFPAFGEGRTNQQTDFNDIAARHGLDAVRRQIEEVLQMS